MRADGLVGRSVRGKEALLALDDRANVRAIEYVTPCTLTLWAPGDVVRGGRQLDPDH